MYERTRALMEEQRKAGIYSGYVTTFLTDNQVFRLTKGDAATLPSKEIMTERHLFDVASLTKVVLTTTVIFRLMDRDLLDIDHPIKDYLPNYCDDQVTIREILTHTSGIECSIENRDQLSAPELKAAYLSQKSGPKRSSQVKYTDSGFILLGFMLEELYGEPLADIFRKEVLEPLHMNKSFFHKVPKDEKVVPTVQLSNGTILKGVVHDTKARILGESSGHAGLFSCISDLEVFVQMYLSDDGTYLSREIIHQAQKNQTVLLQEPRGLGWKLIKNEGETFIFHTGYTGTFILMDLKRRVGWIFLSNRVHPIDRQQIYNPAREKLITCFIEEYREKIIKKHS